MEFVQLVIDFILHIDRHLAELTAAYGPWIYGILFLIIFCETGLVVTPSCRATRCCSSLARSGPGRDEHPPDGHSADHRRHASATPSTTASAASSASGCSPTRTRRSSAAAIWRSPRPSRQTRRQDHHPRPLRAHRAHLRPLRRRHRPHPLHQLAAYNVVGAIAWVTLIQLRPAISLRDGVEQPALPHRGDPLILVDLLPGGQILHHRRAAKGNTSNPGEPRPFTCLGRFSTMPRQKHPKARSMYKESLLSARRTNCHDPDNWPQPAPPPADARLALPRTLC